MTDNIKQRTIEYVKQDARDIYNGIYQARMILNNFRLFYDQLSNTNVEIYVEQLSNLIECMEDFILSIDVANEFFSEKERTNMKTNMDELRNKIALSSNGPG